MNGRTPLAPPISMLMTACEAVRRVCFFHHLDGARQGEDAMIGQPLDAPPAARPYWRSRADISIVVVQVRRHP
jgi:hypothetical protein